MLLFSLVKSGTLGIISCDNYVVEDLHYNFRLDISASLIIWIDIHAGFVEVYGTLNYIGGQEIIVG